MRVAGSNVRTIRKQLGLSLRTVAKEAGIEPATLSRIENNKANLTEELAAKIAAVLHVSVGILFADPGVLEMAMLHMRKAPLLTPEQLLAWTGPDSFEEAEEQIYLHTSIQTGSRLIFAVSVLDAANEPEILQGDEVIFDADRIPQSGDVILAQAKDSTIHIGRFRAAPGPHPTFDVVPLNRMFRELTSGKPALLVVRGVRAEQRRYFRE